MSPLLILLPVAVVLFVVCGLWAVLDHLDARDQEVFEYQLARWADDGTL